MKVKLIANGSRPWERWVRRWGLSFLIDDDILFDAFGDGRVIMENLRRFNVDISKITQAAVSHEHWDHVDGFRVLLAEKQGLRIYLPSHVDAVIRDKIRSWGGDVVEARGILKLKDGVYLSGEVFGRYADKNMSEQALVLETGKGLVIVAGCAHPGIMEIVKHVKTGFQKPVYGVIGGFHLKDRSLEEISIEAARLGSAGIRMIVPLHCTGRMAEKVFHQVFGTGCVFLREGQDIGWE